MTENLHELYAAVDRLNHEEMEELRDYLDQRMMQPQITDENPKTRAAALMAAVENFWEGMSQQEIDEIVEDMNSEYIEPLDPDDDTWLNDEDNA